MQVLRFSLLLLLACGYSIAGPMTTAEPPAPPPNFRINQDFIPKTYDVHLIIAKDFHSTKVFTGETTIRVSRKDVSKKTMQIHMDSAIAKSVTIWIENIKLTANEMSYNELTEIMDIFVETRRKSFDVRFTFGGKLYDDMYGFYLSNVSDTQFLATTQFEPTYARRAFPCFDEPQLKANFKVALTVPNEFHAISNQPGTKTGPRFTFDETPRMSTYLIAFVVSKFKSRQVEPLSDDLSMAVWAPEKLYENTKFAASISRKIVDNLGKLLGGENHKFEKMGIKHLDQVAIPDFAAGAMENWGLVTYREAALLVDEDYVKVMDKEQVVKIIAHEFAHSWFGNWVTMKWWSDTWLNEGFARYFEARGLIDVDEAKTYELDKQFVLNTVHPIMETDGNAGALPLSSTVSDVNTVADIREKFGTITYNKGGSIVRMMEKIVGKKSFLEILQNYINKYKNTNTEPNNLFDEFDKVKVGNRDVPFKKIMSDWVTTSGYPVVTASLREGKVVLRQEQFLYDKEEAPEEKKYWYVPITLKMYDIPEPVTDPPATLPSDSTATDLLGTDTTVAEPTVTDWPATDDPITGPTMTKSHEMSTSETDSSTSESSGTDTTMTDSTVSDSPATDSIASSIVSNSPETSTSETDSSTSESSVTDTTMTDSTVSDFPATDDAITNSTVSDPPETGTSETDSSTFESSLTDTTITNSTETDSPITDDSVATSTVIDSSETVTDDSTETEEEEEEEEEEKEEAEEENQSENKVRRKPRATPTVAQALQFLEPNDEETIIEGDLDKAIIINPENAGFYRVNYDTELWNRIIQLLKNDHTQVESITRAQLINDAMNLARANQLEYSTAIDLLKYLEWETEYYPWRAAFTAFSYLRKRLAGDNLRKDITDLMNTLMAKFYTDNKEFNIKDNTKAIAVYTKVLALEWACELDGEQCVKDATNLFKPDATRATNNIDPNLESIIFCSGLRHTKNDQADWDKMWMKYTLEKNAAMRATILTSLGCTKNPDILTKFLKKSVDDPAIRSQDASSVFRAVLAGNPEGVDVSLNFFNDNFGSIVEKYKSMGALSNIILQISDRITTAEQVTKFEYLIEVNKDDLGDAAKVAENALLAAKANLKWAETAKQKLNAYLNPSKGGASSLVSTSLLVLLVCFIVARFV